MSNPSRTTKSLQEQEEQEEQLKRQLRQERAAQKFSKERFMKPQAKNEQQVSDEQEPHKTALQATIRANLKFDLIVQLKTMGIDFNDQEKSAAWLNLAHYDFKGYEQPNSENSQDIPARCLLNLNDFYGFHRGIVCGYISNKEKYKFSYADEQNITKYVLVPRLYLCFDTENPARYCDRLAKAYFERIVANSQYRLHCYIECMPTDDVGSIGQKGKKGIFNFLEGKKQQFPEESKESLMTEVEQQYCRTMNSIIMQKNLIESKQHIVANRLIIPPNKNKKAVPLNGLIQIKRERLIVIEANEKSIIKGKTFIDAFKLFCSSAIHTEKSVAASLKEIKNECDRSVIDQAFKSLRDKPEPTRFQVFQNDQMAIIQRSMFKLRGDWIKNIKEKVEGAFRKNPNWFSTSIEPHLYPQSRTKRYFNIVKLMMEDALRELSHQSLHRISDDILWHVPDEVEVQSVSKVINRYPADRQEKTCLPLFETDLTRTLDNSGFSYTVPIPNFVNLLLSIFTRLVDELNRVPEVQQKIMIELFKKMKGQRYLSAPNRNPTPPNQIDQYVWLKDLYNNLVVKLEKAIEPLEEYLRLVNLELSPILQMKPEEIIQRIDKEDQQNPKDIKTLKDDIEAYYQKEKELQQRMPEWIHISMFRIHLKDVVENLTLKYQNIAKGLELIVAKKAKKATKALAEKFQEIRGIIRTKPLNIEKLIEMRNYMNALNDELEKLRKEIDDSEKIYAILEEFKFIQSPEDIKRRYQVMTTPKSIIVEVEKKKKDIQVKKVEFDEQLVQQQEQFKNNIESLTRTITQFHTYSKRQTHEQTSHKVRIINQTIANSLSEAQKFNSREHLFDKTRTDYSKVQELAKQFLPYSHLWLTTNSWARNQQTWLYGEWNSIDAEECEKFVEDGIKNLGYAIRVFRQKEITHILAIVELVKGEIEQFRPKVPLLLALRKSGLRERHWTQISQKVGIRVYPEPDFTFKKCLDSLKLMSHLDTCVEISQQATKEYAIENSLIEMSKAWENISLQFGTFKTGYIVKSFDEVVALVDEHIANTQSMLFSPFKKPFEERIIDWFGSLKKISDIIEEWTKLQINWMYLQPIFDSPDIAKQLHKESKNFKSIDLFWRGLITKARQVVNAEKICQTEELLDKLKDANNSLDIIQKSLNNYLESKRAKFARFYFLSNNELLEILSQAKEPLAVQPYLKKVFENIAQVEFDTAGKKTILAMLSAERQKIPFEKIVDPKGKNVQDWMTEVEAQMKSSLRAALLTSIHDYSTRNRSQWVLMHPGQCVLNGSQVHWTTQVQAAVKNHTVNEYFRALTDQLAVEVELVRRKLSKNQSVTLNALIVIDVHARDVVENLGENNVDDINAFQWISQLRYYWQDDDCIVKCVQTAFPYGYEYLGNTLRLVITPLTDKCYMTLMGALKLNLGGAPAGPAGTGKTETTKDLAKALAKQCVVFNCSDSMDFIMVGKFFKGLAAAGAWACFDEFNRINIEVLSVIAQQLLILFTEKAKGSTTVEFEGSEIRLQAAFSVFITMNPGYAGRTELPDNLKALFRPVAMMVPDYAMIGQIMLYSFGFKKGRELAKKMVVTFRLASEQLSSQDHYDYGMRAVRSVINAAGILKEKDPDMDEDKLLLRALRDVNVPKFLKDDLPLFQNIIQDLFPGFKRQAINYGSLLDSIQESCKLPEFNFKLVEAFQAKTIQLYDTIQVRHGLMLVGSTGGGKTSAYKVLKTALTRLQSEGFYKVNTHIINPKSINMGQLYGMFNEASREWIDGVLAYTVRKCCSDQSTQKHWVMFDGPVDALWIENMNTVLDDNKKLCLNSGQILTLTPHMTMMFEVQDLAVASPATVSRCGMVYMEPAALGVEPLTHQWLKCLPPKVGQSNKCMEGLDKFIKDVVYPLIGYVRQYCKEMVASTDQNLLQSFFRLVNCFLQRYYETEIVKVTAEDISKLEQIFQNFLIFSTVWSIGASCDFDGRKKFNDELRRCLAKRGVVLQENYFKCYFDENMRMFESWSALFAGFKITPELGYHEIIVPTVDSQSITYVARLLLLNNSHVMIPGPTGTGKTVNCSNLLTSGLTEIYQYIPIAFSAQTSANQTQDTIDLKLEKIKRGVFGAPVGKKYVIFVDDLNMPKKEEYGAQPPIELLRQFLDHHGWYNRKDQQFMRIENIILLTALGPPGGGRTHITQRLVRHFSMLSYTELEKATISSIFKALTSFFFRKFAEEVRNLSGELVSSVIDIYDSIKANLLPTPKKSHYTFNLRDISKVFQGICGASPKDVSTADQVVKLWKHEITRVFGDRLINSEDSHYLLEELIRSAEQFNMSADVVAEPVLYCDFWAGKDINPRQYARIPNQQQLMTKIYELQEEYNADPRFSGVRGKNAMRLVLFQDACEHICRIVRIIRQPNGNALLLGVGGSGRQSLAKIAIFISCHTLTFIELIKNYSIKSWREDLRKILIETGLEDRQTTFLFTDTQIINEQLVEDLNSVLNSGDVTGLYAEKDLDDIMNACRSDCLKRGLQPNKMNIFSQYLIRVKRNIHIVIAMSPLSTSFSTRLRMFPSLVNCCTLDWFSEWPQEALLAVGRGQLKEFLEENELDSMQKPLIEFFKSIHKSVERVSVSYLAQLRRYNYVTPMSYLQLLKMFRIILKEKQSELKNSINRLKTGLDKLIAANTEVADMQIQLKDLQPQLEKSAIETEQLMKQIQVEKKDSLETEKIVSKEENQAKIQTQQALQIAKEVDIKVQDANVKLSQSLKAVDRLKTDHLVEIKSHKSPPKVAVLVLGGCVVLFQDMIQAKGHEIVMRKIEGTIKKEEDWFNTARLELLQNPKTFLDQLKNYDKEHINQSLIAKLNQKIMKDPDFTYEKAKAVGGPIEALYLWTMAMYSFNKIYLDTEPLREKEAEVKHLVATKTAMLNEKKKILNSVIEKIRNLEKSFNDCISKKDELTKKILECEVKLDRAKKLTSGLSDQKSRWTLEIERLCSLTKYLPGNSILAAAMISYGGAFTASYRTTLQKEWIQKMTTLKILIEPKTSLVQFLGKPVLIQQWTMAGLPKDENSIENGIIIEKGRRWPLMIDPQGQANKFIKSIGRDHHVEGIDVIKQKEDSKLIKTLELAIQNGKCFLLENVGQQLDKSLDPILLQQVVKQSGGLSISLGDKTISYNDHFKMFISTTLPNPHYSPETFVKVTIINFAITPKGLEDQMLAELVALQNPQLEQKKKDIVRRNAADQKELLNIEDSILQSLSQGSGGIAELLLDETLINQLQNSKKFASQINQRILDSKVTEQQIDRTREGYRSVAYRASLLFFCIIDLSGIDPMYQYSLQWFVNLFKMAVENALPAKELEVRLGNLINYFTYSLYQNVCRSLFQKHKLLFSFLLTAKIQFGKKEMDPIEWRYFLAGPSGDIKIEPNTTDWISDSSWPDIFRQFYGLQRLPALSGLYTDFMDKPDTFKYIFDSSNPQDQALPNEWQQKLNEFQRLIVLKTLRLDKVLPGIENWICNRMGKKFIIPPTFDLAKCFKDSTCLTPLIFMLSPGSDPVTDFRRFAKEADKRTESISLGQGQGPKAHDLVKAGQVKGSWILLQNCHLAASWMSELQKVVQQFGENTHKDFRLWLTSMPTGTFPISVLQNGVKMTIEPPQGLRANLLRSYNSLNDEQFNSCQKPTKFKKLLFGFCFFHAIIQDRRKFGPIGWNIAYQFTNEDLNVCKRQLRMLLQEYSTIPYKVLNYLGAEINYGGRVTDDKDVRLIKTILKKYITPDVFKEDYKFSRSGHYYSPNLIELPDYVKYIEGLPLNPAPQAFGLHENAQITTAQNQTLSLLENILQIQPRQSSGGGKNREDIIYEIAQSIQSKTPPVFDLVQIAKKYPTDYKESMNTVLVQQLVRYNRLLEVMKDSLASLKRALKGLVVMSEDLEKLSNSIYDNQVGKLWSDKGFLSLKPLGSWIEDLIKRVEFLTDWITNGTPVTFWMSGFFFPQAFVTGSLQNYARSKSIAIDKLFFRFTFLDNIAHQSEITKKPQAGCYVYGLFLQGCRWSYSEHLLTESKPKELFSQLPVLHLQPCEQKPKGDGIYNCPLYKVASRSGTLSTTGHSTNFVMYIELPTNRPQDQWICSGVAAFLALRY